MDNNTWWPEKMRQDGLAKHESNLALN